MVSKGEYISLNGIAIAKCTYSEKEGSLDTAFCEITNSSYEGSNLFHDTRKLSTNIGTIIQGQSIEKIGCKTKITAGMIKYATGIVLTDDGVKGDVAFSLYASEFGGSGGLVYQTVSGTYKAIGLHIARGRNIDTIDSNVYSIFCKSSNIESKMLLTRY